MAKIYTSVDQLIGGTPLLELRRMAAEAQLQARLLVKLEYFNPAGSVKDRVAKAMLDEAEQRGLSVTQEEVDAELAGQRKNYEEYEEVRSYIDDYCTKMGITTEQYFDTVAEQLPRVILRQRLRDTLGQEYCQQHGLEFTKVNPPEQMTEYVEQYLDGLLQAHRSEIKYY